MVPRTTYMERLRAALARSPVTALLGPRQCGKTTLARMLTEEGAAGFFDLESPADRNRLQNPEFALGSLEGLVVIDEVQTMPELFAVLRVLVDRPDSRQRFLILGSASPDTVRGTSESLAGRVEFVDLAGFDLGEVGTAALERLWIRGGFPRSFLADSEADSQAWREAFIRTFLERDLPALGVGIAPVAMRRFWMMLAHYHGQTLNASELARAMGVSDKTVRSYLDLLTGTFMVRQLQPWFENISKRQVKAPKIYLRDSGLLHSLLSIDSRDSLLAHPRVGASWEGFAIEQVLRIVQPSDSWFWATHSGAELDLLVHEGGRRYGVEVKFSEAPSVTRSMRSAIADLRLDRLWVLAPVPRGYPLGEQISVLSLGELETLR